MAQDTIDKIINIQFNYNELIEGWKKTTQAIEENKKTMSDLKEEFKNGQMSADEYRQSQVELKNIETALKGELRQYNKEIQNNIKIETKAAGSVDQLRANVSKLTAQYNALSAAERESASGQRLAAHIKAQQEALNEAEMALGNYRSQVGNYENAIKNALPFGDNLIVQLAGAAQKAGGVTKMFKQATTALSGLVKQSLAFIATPLGAAIAALVVLYKALKSSVDDLNEAINGNVNLQQMQSREQAKVSAWRAAEQVANEESAKQWIKFKGAISEAWTAYKIFWKYANTHQFDKLWNIVTTVGDMRDAALQVEDLKKQLHEFQVGDPEKGRLGSIEKMAELTSEIKELREKAADQENYSDEEREAALRQALEKNKELYAMKRKELDLQLQIDEAQHKASPDDAQFQQDWARHRAQMKELNGQEADANRMLIRSLNKFAVDDTEDAAKKAAEETEKVLRETLKLQQDARAETEANELQTVRENYAQELADFNKMVEEKGVSEEAAAGYRKALSEKTEADIAEIRKKYRDMEAEAAAKAAKELIVIEDRLRTTILSMRQDSADKEIELTNQRYAKEREKLELKLRTDENLTVEAQEMINKLLIALEEKRLDEVSKIRAKWSEKQLNEEIENEQKRIRMQWKGEQTLQSIKLKKSQADNYESLNTTDPNRIFEKNAAQLQQAQAELEAAEQTKAKIAAMSEDEYTALYGGELQWMNAAVDAELAVQRAKQRTNDIQLQGIKLREAETQMAIQGAQQIIGALGDLAEAAGASAEMSAMLAIAESAAAMGEALHKAFSEGATVWDGIMGAVAAIATITTIISQIKSLNSSAAGEAAKYRYAEGGLITGPGTGTSDSIVARVSNGEAVMTAAAVADWGAVLSAINVSSGGKAIDTSRLPSRNGGGMEQMEEMMTRVMQEVRPQVSVVDINRGQSRVQVSANLGRMGSRRK